MNLTAVAWKVVPRLPGWLNAVVFAVAANGAWLLRSKNTKRLEHNLAKVVPEAGRAALRRLSRQAMRRNLKYYREALTMGGMSGQQIDRLVHLADRTAALARIGPRRQAILVLSHMGNWDAAGAWACRNVAPVITVAEHVQPETVFEDFMSMRAKIGMTIIPIEKGTSAYQQLLAAAQTDDPYLICIVADRDLSNRGLEVDWFGRRAMVGAGPAALALATGRPLFPVSMHTVGKAYQLRFHPIVEVPASGTKTQRVRQMTQQWVTALEAAIKQSPADWHMFQKVFVEDLDPDKAPLAGVSDNAQQGSPPRSPAVNQGAEPAPTAAAPLGQPAGPPATPPHPPAGEASAGAS